jgi:hypothetical protein
METVQVVAAQFPVENHERGSLEALTKSSRTSAVPGDSGS